MRGWAIEEAKLRQASVGAVDAVSTFPTSLPDRSCLSLFPCPKRSNPTWGSYWSEHFRTSTHVALAVPIEKTLVCNVPPWLMPSSRAPRARTCSSSVS